MTQKGENVADNSSKSPTTSGAHPSLCEHSENPCATMNFLQRTFSRHKIKSSDRPHLKSGFREEALPKPTVGQLAAKRLPDKLPIGHRKDNNSFLKQKDCYRLEQSNKPNQQNGLRYPSRVQSRE